MAAQQHIRTRIGLTLIELLIVIGIIGLLIQLALPAVQMAREAARRAHCQNNLRQLAVGSHLHLNTHGYFPSGGWTNVWVGDPNLGFGKEQPGGWCYNLLPYVEQAALHDLGLGAPDAERRKLAADMFATPVPVFNCPSRRASQAWLFIYSGALANSDDHARAGRSDYAANIGNMVPFNRLPGPESVESTEEPFNWSENDEREAEGRNGIVFQRGEVTPAMIEDGLSKTYLFGEKFMDPDHYYSGVSPGDDQSLYVGFDRDNVRSGHVWHPPMLDKRVPLVWLPEDDETVTDWNFGSAHPAGCHMALCDGSVRRIDYDIEIEVHSALSGRNDGESAASE